MWLSDTIVETSFTFLRTDLSSRLSSIITPTKLPFGMHLDYKQNFIRLRGAEPGVVVPTVFRNV